MYNLYKIYYVEFCKSRNPRLAIDFVQKTYVVIYLFLLKFLWLIISIFLQNFSFRMLTGHKTKLTSKKGILTPVYSDLYNILTIQEGPSRSWNGKVGRGGKQNFRPGMVWIQGECTCMHSKTCMNCKRF